MIAKHGGDSAVQIERRAKLALNAIRGIALQRSDFHGHEVTVADVIADAEAHYARGDDRLWQLIGARGGSILMSESVRFAVLALHAIATIETGADSSTATDAPAGEPATREGVVDGPGPAVSCCAQPPVPRSPAASHAPRPLGDPRPLPRGAARWQDPSNQFAIALGVGFVAWLVATRRWWR